MVEGGADVHDVLTTLSLLSSSFVPRPRPRLGRARPSGALRCPGLACSVLDIGDIYDSGSRNDTEKITMCKSA